jgi:cytochrome bd-type quinol oxidase subunit 2
MSASIVQVVIVAVFALTCGALAAAWRRGRLGAVAIGVLLAAVVVWASVFIAIATEFGDANSFATCDSECSAIQYGWAVAFIAPPLLMALAALAMLVVRGTKWRSRRTSARENHA